MRRQSHTANWTETIPVNVFLKVTTFLSSHSTSILHSLFNLRQRWLDQYSIFNSAALVAADLHSVSYPAPLSLLSPNFTTLKTVSDCPQNCLPPAKLGIQQFWALYSSRLWNFPIFPLLRINNSPLFASNRKWPQFLTLMVPPTELQSQFVTASSLI